MAPLRTGWANVIYKCNKDTGNYFVMMCYKDMTFCASDCTNTECHRNFTETVREEAIRWWGSEDVPVAYTDFSSSCDEYTPPPKLRAIQLHYPNNKKN